MNSEPEKIDISHISFKYQDVDVLQDISCSVVKGSITAIIGPNGAGKSTLLKIILGLLKPDSGYVKINGMTVNEARNRKLFSYIPQKESVDWNFPINVFDVVLMGRYSHIGPIRRPSKEDRILALQALKKFGLEGLRDRQIGKLSGGQQQRVFLARSFVQNAEYYFLDEPFQGIDTVTEKVLIETLKELKNQNKTMLIVTHDLQSLSSLFSHVMLLNKRKIDCGIPSKVINHDNLLATYGSHLHIGQQHEEGVDHSFIVER